MAVYSPSIQKLIDSFENYPVLGTRRRWLAFYMLNVSNREAEEFLQAILNAKKDLKFCLYLL